MVETQAFVFSAPECGTNPGWRKNNNVCYYYNDTDTVDFHTAMNRCDNEKAMLVSILNIDEQAYVNSMVCLLLSSGQQSTRFYDTARCVMVSGSFRWAQERSLQPGLD